jgi:hypothetical protein
MPDRATQSKKHKSKTEEEEERLSTYKKYRIVGFADYEETMTKQEHKSL